MAAYRNLTPAEIRERMLAGDADLVVLDVREPDELVLARVTGTLDIPMSQLGRRIAEIDRAKEIAVLCHHGTRSQWVAQQLVRAGFPRVANIRGGIDAWARDVDPSVGSY